MVNIAMDSLSYSNRTSRLTSREDPLYEVACLVWLKLVQNGLNDRPLFVRKVAWVADRRMSILFGHVHFSEVKSGIRIMIAHAFGVL
ncbi:hypothetical protein [Thiocapsa imhoffii]|uniref:hypothetical protein n=1 Tax=Thiocapsa imhoffii TaxID=382777 RepID=UPI003FCD77FE